MQLFPIIEAHFVGSIESKKYQHKTLADYYAGTWAEEKKPFVDPDTGSKSSSARFVSAQVWFFCFC